MSAFVTANGSIAAASGVTADGTFDISSLSNGGASVKTLAGTSAGAVDLGANDLTLTAAAKATFAGTIRDGGTNGGAGGAVTIAGGTETLSGQNTYTGGTTVSGTLDLASADTFTGTTLTSGGAGTGAITFAGTRGDPATLALDMSAQSVGGTFGNTLGSFGADDSLDLKGLTCTSGSTTLTTDPTNNADELLTVTENGMTETFILSSPGAATYYAHPDAAGTSIDTVCFAAGTSIRTTQGNVAVQHLHVGDLAVTASGRLRPVLWLGHRVVDCRNHPRPNEVLPVRIAAHAFGVGSPSRDLLLSPGHPVLVGADEDGAGGHLVPIMCLINGTTIERVTVDEVTYWHVELDSHDVLLAEGLPAESYIDLGTRAWFAGAEGALYDPDMALPGMPGRCRPVAIDGRWSRQSGAGSTKSLRRASFLLPRGPTCGMRCWHSSDEGHPDFAPKWAPSGDGHSALCVTSCVK